MRITILVDNQANRNLCGEWGLSILIEADGQKILLDTGASGLFRENAAQLGLSLTDLNYLILSHGHLDHTWGLPSLIQDYLANQTPIAKRPVLVAHPLITAPKFRDDGSEFGIWFSEATLTRHFKTNFNAKPQWLTENLLFLGEIPRCNSFESQHPLGKVALPDGLTPDYLTDDTALVYRSKKGLIIITGCSHSGICNIVKQAQNLCKEERIVDIVGGFHLLNAEPVRLSETLSFFKNLKPEQLHPCHCTDFHAKAILQATLPIKEVNVGLQLKYN
jgi:7,8-dihydropterin-6-yl-methyl-4-(beta-D-ribofuranosyl)aminobenzene 5'-phosphate synthase